MKKSFLNTLMISGAMLLCFSATAQQDGYKVGDKAIDFNLQNVDGNWVSMAEQQDAKGFVVVFSCNTCPYVVAYEDRMIDLHEKYAPMGYPLIAINSNDEKSSPGDSFDKMKERAESKSFPFAYVYDESQEVIKTYGATNTPHVYLLNREGADYVVKYIGAIDNNYQDESKVTEKYLEDALDAVINGDPVARASTKAIGCTIKWKKTE